MPTAKTLPDLYTVCQAVADGRIGVHHILIYVDTVEHPDRKSRVDAAVVRYDGSIETAICEGEEAHKALEWENTCFRALAAATGSVGAALRAHRAYKRAVDIATGAAEVSTVKANF